MNTKEKADKEKKKKGKSPLPALVPATVLPVPHFPQVDDRVTGLKKTPEIHVESGVQV